MNRRENTHAFDTMMRRFVPAAIHPGRSRSAKRTEHGLFNFGSKPMPRLAVSCLTVLALIALTGCTVKFSSQSAPEKLDQRVPVLANVDVLRRPFPRSKPHRSSAAKRSAEARGFNLKVPSLMLIARPARSLNTPHFWLKCAKGCPIGPALSIDALLDWFREGTHRRENRFTPSWTSTGCWGRERQVV